jgi:DNA-binding transcriptional MerR regulator
MHYLDRKEVAALLHCCVRSLNNYERAGLLPKPYRVGRKHLWLHAELIEFIRLHQASQPKTAKVNS